MRWLFACLTIAGCARAGKENVIIGGLNDARPKDAVDIAEPDASPIDAPPSQITLSATTSGGITPNNSFGCVTMDRGLTLTNSYYRVFTLADFGVTTTLHVTQVDFGIQTAAAGGGATNQPAMVNLGLYAMPPQGDTLDLAQIRPLSSASIQIPNGSGSRMTVPITGDVPSTTSAIVELAIPDGTAAGNKFFIGTNTSGERSPGYTMSTDCQVNAPTAMSSFGLGEVDMVMTVTGTR